MSFNPSGISRGYLDFLNQSQERDIRDQALSDAKRKAVLEMLLQKRKDDAEGTAGDTLATMYKGGGDQPIPQPPSPGQSSQPMQAPQAGAIPPPPQPQNPHLQPPVGGMRPGFKAPPAVSAAQGQDRIMIVKQEFQKATNPQDKIALTNELKRLGVPDQQIMQWAQEAAAMQGIPVQMPGQGQGIPPPPGAAPQGQPGQPQAMPVSMQGQPPQGMPPPPQGQPPGPPIVRPAGQPGAPAGGMPPPPAAAPQQPPPYQAVPTQPPQPPQQDGGGIPAPPQPAQQPGQQFNFENVVQNLMKQGLSGQKLWQALNILGPRMDANYKQQLQALNQQVAMYKEQDRARHESVMEDQGERKVGQADERVKQGEERIDVQRENAATARTRAADAQKRFESRIGNGNFDDSDVKYWGDAMIAGLPMPSRMTSMLGGQKLQADVMKYVARTGIDPKNILQNQAEQAGAKSAQRAIGTKTANVEMAVNEADQLADLALSASDDFKRTGYKKLNDMYQAVEAGTANPEMRKFVAANTSFINTYARAISPSGTPTVNDKDHAREMLDTAYSEGDYAAVIDQLKKEMSAAKSSPGKVKQEMREQNGAKPSAIPNANAKGWTLHTDKNGNKAYVSPDGKQFEEVK